MLIALDKISALPFKLVHVVFDVAGVTELMEMRSV